MASLTEAERAAFDERGFLHPFPVLDAARLQAALATAERISAWPEPGRSFALKNKTHLLSRTLHDIVTLPAITDRVAALIGPDLLAWGAGFFFKPAHSPDFVSWHQDATYWGLSPPDVVTAWVALTPSTVESGCMRVVPGTHKGRLPHADTYGRDNMLSRGQEIAVEVDLAHAVDLVLAPGEMSLHHVLIAHGSDANRAAHPRIGFAIRYIAAHVRQEGGFHDSATLARGTDRFGHFRHEPKPKGEFAPEDIAAHEAIVKGAVTSAAPVKDKS